MLKLRHQSAFNTVGQASMRQHQSFELMGSSADLLALTHQIVAFAVMKVGPHAGPVWFRSSDGNLIRVGIGQRDLEDRFEVFTLQVDSDPSESPPSQAPFEPWPFQEWQVDVLRRAEFVVPGASGPTLGSDPNTQSAAPPGMAPPEALAVCEVAAGVIFSCGNRRLLFGVDWFPFAMVVSDDSGAIDDYTSCCEVVGLRSYVSGVTS